MISNKPDYEREVIEMNKTLLNRLISGDIGDNKSIEEPFKKTILECHKFANNNDVTKVSNSCFSSVMYLVTVVEGGKEYFKTLDVDNITMDVYEKLLYFYSMWKSKYEVDNDNMINESSKYLRLQADFDNYKKRTIREESLVKSKIKYSLVSDILDIFDDLELAKKNEPNNEGINIIYNKLSSYLNKNGVSEIDCVGEFNPDIHECLTVVNNGIEHYNTIVDVVKKGYSIDGSVVRYPKVIISK